MLEMSPCKISTLLSISQRVRKCWTYTGNTRLQPVGELELFLLKPGFGAAGHLILSGLWHQIAREFCNKTPFSAGLSCLYRGPIFFMPLHIASVAGMTLFSSSGRLQAATAVTTSVGKGCEILHPTSNWDLTVFSFHGINQRAYCPVWGF